TAGMLAARAIKGTGEQIYRGNDKWLAADGVSAGEKKVPGTFAEQISEAGSLTAQAFANGARAFASAARIAGQGLSSVLASTGKLAGQPAQPSGARLGLSGTVQRIANDAEQGISLLFDIVSTASEGFAEIVGGAPGGIGQPPGKKRVAILGGGVAGMSAAQEL